MGSEIMLRHNRTSVFETSSLGYGKVGRGIERRISLQLITDKVAGWWRTAGVRGAAQHLQATNHGPLLATTVALEALRET